jgi:hypothetical protein
MCILHDSEPYQFISGRVVKLSHLLCYEGSCNYKQYSKSVLHISVCYILVCDMVKDWIAFICQIFMIF